MEPMMFPPEKMLISVAKFKAATKRVLINVKTKVRFHYFDYLYYRVPFGRRGIAPTRNCTHLLKNVLNLFLCIKLNFFWQFSFLYLIYSFGG